MFPLSLKQSILITINLYIVFRHYIIDDITDCIMFLKLSQESTISENIGKRERG